MKLFELLRPLGLVSDAGTIASVSGCSTVHLRGAEGIGYSPDALDHVVAIRHPGWHVLGRDVQSHAAQDPPSALRQNRDCEDVVEVTGQFTA